MWLIADSGGTSTTWVYGNEKIAGRLRTASLHPRNIDRFPDEDRRKLEDLADNFLFKRIDFYGAGMSNAENASRISNFLSHLGFANVQIHTDALAAGLACCGNDHGYVAILGTGSILIEMNGGEMTGRAGGLGADLGDEGSGYYFSKLLLNYLEEDRNWTNELKNLLGSKEEFQKKYNSTTSPSELAKLAGITSKLNLTGLHQENFDRFIETHLLDLEPEKKILNIVGSYGCSLEAILSKELERYGWQLGKCLVDPVDELVNRMFKKN